MFLVLIKVILVCSFIQTLTVLIQSELDRPIIQMECGILFNFKSTSMEASGLGLIRAPGSARQHEIGQPVKVRNG